MLNVFVLVVTLTGVNAGFVVESGIIKIKLN